MNIRLQEPQNVIHLKQAKVGQDTAVREIVKKSLSFLGNHLLLRLSEKSISEEGQF